MYDEIKKQMLEACLKMNEYELIALSGGNVSVRVGENRFLVTPSAINYDRMTYEDIVLIDENCNVLEGNRKPSSDSKPIVYIFQHMPEVNAIIHTHQPYATAIGMVQDKLPACMVTLIDACQGDVTVAPWTPSSDIGMGKLCVEYGKDSRAVIMKRHGVIAYGPSLDDALFSAVYLEEGAKTYLLAKLIGEVTELPKEEIIRELGGMDHYGQ
ncbi:MAG: class II aldolase/adducin family protein [Erysipelotrichaceae bacterium]|nr:class II aldolase/adducin family protein [Erysipelotrichaceae bacterium]MBQ2582403.1 class II aldolase/adducin family protein [Erysipelotrichaceae bacterium]